MNNYFEFSVSECKAMGEFVAALVKAGVEFNVRGICGAWRVTCYYKI